MPNYIRKPYKLVARGVGLRHPPDLLPDGLYPVVNNMTARILGGLQVRAGITPLNTLNYGAPVHSIRRLNDETNNSFMQLIGAGTSIFDTTSTTAIDSGYSGNPLSMVPFRPNQSPRSWMYLSDGTRSRKVRTDRTNYVQGIAPAAQPPVVTRGVPQFNIVEMFNAVGTWTNSGTAGAISTPNRFATTINQILYDSGTTGWASVNPVVADKNLQPGALIIFNAVETAKVRQVFEPVVNTTIQSIMYDFGIAGLCSLVLTDQTTGLQPDAMLQITGAGPPASEYIRVLSASRGVDGTVSIRCSTVGTRHPGDTVTGVASFRVYTVGAFVNGQSLTGAVFQTSVTSGLGYLSRDLHLAPINEAMAWPNGTGTGASRPIQPEDYVHLSLQVDNPVAITNIRVILNVDPVFPADFTKIQNAYYKDISPSVFQPVINSTLTVFAAQQSAVQQSIINSSSGSLSGPDTSGFRAVPAAIPAGNPTGGIITVPSATPNIDYTVPGDNAWTEFQFKVGEMSPIGSAQTTTLAQVTGLILVIQATSTVVVLVSSWWIGGTYGLDSQGNVPYIFYQRYRSSATGARSNPSPIQRAPIDIQRERAVITTAASTDPQVDKIDLFALGGTLDQPRLALTAGNASANVNIDVKDLAIRVNEILSFKNFQPFPIADTPHSGLVNVAGTSVTLLSGDLFNINWQTGSQIVINNAVYTLYGPPAAQSRLELIENAGSGSSVTVFIPEATIGGVPLPAMFGPDPQTGCLLGVGTGKDAGTLYWTNPNDPDAAADGNTLEITSPSEPLQTGFIYDGRAYVYSVERLFNVYATSRTDAATGLTVIAYTAQEVPNSKGSYGIYSMTVTQNFYSVARDGVWEVGDTGLGNVTDEQLYPLFPHKGQIGTLTNGYYPIDFTQPNAIRLFATKAAIFLTYFDTNGNYQVIAYDRSIPQPGWFPLKYTPAPRVIYEEEGPSLTSVLMGGQDGAVYQVGKGTTDNGVPIAFDFYTPASDLGDSRLQKLWSDYMLDADLQLTTVTLTPVMNNLLIPLAPVTVSGLTGRQQIPETLITNPLALYLNFSLHVQGSSSSSPPVFYEIQPNGVIQPYLATQRTSPNFVSHGFQTYGHLHDGWLTYISTAPLTLTITTDAGLSYTVTVPSSGGVMAKKYITIAAIKGLLFFYSVTSPSPYALFDDETIIHAKEWGSAGAYVPFRPFAGQAA